MKPGETLKEGKGKEGREGRAGKKGNEGEEKKEGMEGKGCEEGKELKEKAGKGHTQKKKEGKEGGKEEGNAGMGKSADGCKEARDEREEEVELAKMLGGFTSEVRGHVRADGRLDMAKFFRNSLPVKLEIASGAGEWAAAQAAADAGRCTHKHAHTHHV